MAKLSARGRTQLAEAVLEYGDHGDTLIDWERITVRLMSDGFLLEKRDVRFRPDAFNSTGRKHSYGWKTISRYRNGANAELFRQDFEEKNRARQEKGANNFWSIA